MVWKKGESGNLQGAKLHKMRSFRQLLRDLSEERNEDYESDILDTIITKAREGDPQFCSIVADRLYPKVKPRELPIEFEKFTGTPTEAGEQVLGMLADGKLDTDQAANLLGAIAQQVKIAEFDELRREMAEMRKLLEAKR